VHTPVHTSAAGLGGNELSWQAALKGQRLDGAVRSAIQSPCFRAVTQHVGDTIRHGRHDEHLMHDRLPLARQLVTATRNHGDVVDMLEEASRQAVDLGDRRFTPREQPKVDDHLDVRILSVADESNGVVHAVVIPR
jgi:hypothetical protein